MQWPWPVPDRPLHPVRRSHLEEMTGPLGIWQHAQGVTPDEAHGTCTDDVARALTVDLLHQTSLGWAAVRPTARRSFSYLSEAFDPSVGGFRNFRSAAGKWQPEPGSQDSQGRALLSIGIVIRDTPDAAMRADARALFNVALPGARRALLSARDRVGDPGLRCRSGGRYGRGNAAHLCLPGEATSGIVQRPGPWLGLAVAGRDADLRERPAAPRPDRRRAQAGGRKSPTRRAHSPGLVNRGADNETRAVRTDRQRWLVDSWWATERLSTSSRSRPPP